MKLFIDTANIEDIRQASQWGVISGVTTNPSLIAKEGRKLEDVIKEITTLVDGPISAEVDESTSEVMVAQAKELVKKGVKFTYYSLKNDGLKEERDLQTVSNVSKVNNIFLEKEIKKNIAKLRTNKVKPCYKKKIKVEIERTKERHKKKIIQTNLRKKENNN